MSTHPLPKAAPPGPRKRARHGLTIWIMILGFGLAALIATYLLFIEPPPPKKVVIATGSKTGAYYRFARQYAEALKHEGLTLEVRETKGSVENLQLLQDDSLLEQVDLADVASACRSRLEVLG